MKKSIGISALAMFAALSLFISGCSGTQPNDTADNTSSDAPSENNAPINLPSLPTFEGSAAEDSEIYVAPIKGMTDGFIRGVDVSSFLSEVEAGVKYKDYDGNELDNQGFFDFLAQNGVNCIRLRVWNDPYDTKGMAYGGGHNDVNTAIEIGKLATNAGMGVLIDFHCSDFWADPSKQRAPKDWLHLTYDNKKQAMYDFISESVKSIIDAGVNVTMVQVGNEINNGLASETDRTRINELLIQGTTAIRDVSKEIGKDIQIVLHYTNALENAVMDIAAQLKEQNVDYDIFAVSFYTFWHGTAEALTERLKELSETYGKKVMVAETSYLYTNDDGDGSANSMSFESTGASLDYDVSVQGQANEVRAIMEAVKNVGDAGLGVFYWEPAWIPVEVVDPSQSDYAQVYERNKVAWEQYGCGWASSYAATYDPNDAGVYFGGSSWDNQAMFDFYGNPLESLKIFKYVFGGTNTPLQVVRIDDIKAESGINQPLNIPQTVPALMNSGAYQEVGVKWNEDDINAIDTAAAQIYTVSGTATADGTDYNIKCELEIKKINYVQNPGFEEIDMSVWTIEGNGVAREADNNIRSGKYCLKFWDSEAFKYTAEQTITGMPAGTYELGAYLQGGSAGANSTFELYAVVDGQTYTAPSKVSSWQNWDNPVVSDIVVPEGAEVVIGVRVDAIAKCWGAWDDFYMQEQG